jgi:hypothetical protein
MTHGVGLQGVLLATAVGELAHTQVKYEEARAQAFTSRQEGRQDRKRVWGIENVMQAYRWPC